MELWDARIYISQSLLHYKRRCVMYILHDRGTVVRQWPEHTVETELVQKADNEMSLPSKSSAQSVEVPCFWLPVEDRREKPEGATTEQLVFLNRDCCLSLCCGHPPLLILALCPCESPALPLVPHVSPVWKHPQIQSAVIPVPGILNEINLYLSPALTGSVQCLLKWKVLPKDFRCRMRKRQSTVYVELCGPVCTVPSILF